MVEAFALMVTEIRERVSTKGRAARGRFSSYSARSNRTGSKTFNRSGTMWQSLRVRQQSPTRVTAGFSGKANDGFSRFRDSAGNSTIRKNKRGRWVRLSNIELGKILQSKENADILDPDTHELRQFETLLASGLDEQTIRALGFEELGFRASQRSRSLARRADKAMRELGRAHLQMLRG